MTAPVLSPAYPYTVRDAASYLGISVPLVYALAERSELAHLRTSGRVARRIVGGREQRVRVSGRLRFAKADLDAWLAAHRCPAKEDAAARPSIEPRPELPMPAVRRFSR